jgi:hypothetical protein
MKENILLRITSLLSLFFVSVHIAYDVVYGFEKGGAEIIITLPVFAIWLYATLVVNERKWAYVIILMGSLLGLVVPIVHMSGSGLAKQVADHSREFGGFFFVWTTITLGITSIVSIILSVSGLLKRKQST